MNDPYIAPKNPDNQMNSSKVLIREMLEADGLGPEQIDTILETMLDGSDAEQGNIGNLDKIIELQKEKSGNKDLEGLEDIPEDVKVALTGLDDEEKKELIRRYREEQENIRYINSIMGKEEEEKKHIVEDEDKASEEYIKKLLLEEKRKENEKIDKEDIDYIDELLAKELEEKDKRIQQEEKANEEYLKKLLAEEEKKEEEKQPKPTCPICLDDLFSQDVFPLYNCSHLFHIECLESYVIEEIKKRSFPIKCPNPDCKKEIPEDDIKDTLQDHIEYQDIYDDYYINYYVEANPDDYLHCPTPDCKFVFCLEEGPRFDCPECRKSYCMACNTDWHQNMKCEEYQQLKKDQTDDAFIKFAQGMKYKRCPKCKVYVERSEGCNAMTCSRCRTMFCYECGKEGDGHLCRHEGVNYVGVPMAHPMLGGYQPVVLRPGIIQPVVQPRIRPFRGPRSNQKHVVEENQPRRVPFGIPYKVPRALLVKKK